MKSDKFNFWCILDLTFSCVKKKLSLVNFLVYTSINLASKFMILQGLQCTNWKQHKAQSMHVNDKDMCMFSLRELA